MNIVSGIEKYSTARSDAVYQHTRIWKRDIFWGTILGRSWTLRILRENL